MHKLFGSPLSVFFAIATCFALGAGVVGTADTIRIGAILTFTGNGAAPAQNVHDGIVLAIEEINKRGGVNGCKVEVAFADSQSDPQSAAEAFNKIEAAIHPLFYISYSTSDGMALTPLAEKSQVILMGLVTAGIDFTRGRDWVFRYWPLGPAYITPLLRILLDLHVKNLGVI